MKESIVLPLSRHASFSLENTDPIAAALRYAQLGLSVLPIHSIRDDGKCSCGNSGCSSPGKHPMVRHGSKDASTDPVLITQWWGQFPFANIGLATGRVSKLVVVDIDVKNGGFKSLQKLENENDSLAGYRQVLSGGGGRHYYFIAPDAPLKNRTGIMPGVDFRGEGGYIVAPPSMHMSGKRYEWLDLAPMREMPSWLLNIMQGYQSPRENKTSSSAGPEAQRNVTLTSIAGFLKAKGFTTSRIQSILPAVNTHAFDSPLPNEEVARILHSNGRYEEWPPISSLPTSRNSIIPLQEHHLPEPLRLWVCDVCERMQLPLEFVAAPAIVAVSSVIGRKLAIKPLRHDDWTVIPNLWGLLVADPGSMKSAALNQAMKPLNMLEKKARAEFQKACQDQAKLDKDLTLEIECLRQSIKLDWSQGLGRQIQQKKEQLQQLSNQERQVLREKRHKTNDPTIEKLAVILQDNPQGILLLRDELSGWLESLSKSGREGSREFYLEAWNGNGSFSIDRIGRGSTFTESICLSVFGGIQPEKLQKYMDKYEASYGQDGFLERFQVAVYPEPIGNWTLIERRPNEDAFQKVFDLFATLDGMTMGEGSPIDLGFSDSAQKIANEWRAALERRLLDSELDSAKKSYLSKYRSLMPSLAIIFEVIGTKSLPREISDDATSLAIHWTEILESHMNKILQMGPGTESGARVLLKNLKAGNLYNGQKVREIYRNQWKGLNSAEKVNEALQLLIQHGYVRKHIEGVGGQASEVIFINPNLGGLS